MTSALGLKLVRGRRISVGEHAFLYDVDVRAANEEFESCRQPCLGRQIAVSKSYICYGLEQAFIYIININSNLRYLFLPHSERVNDMVFFSKDVHLLASAGIDGRIIVLKMSEGLDEKNNPQITAKTIIALKIVGEDEIKNPRVCWHCDKQVILVVGVGNSVLRIDTSKVVNADTCTAEDPLQCSVVNLVPGIQLVGNHKCEVTDLSMCQWTNTCLVVTASVDGEVKIWKDQDHEGSLLYVFSPYGGEPVFAANFLTAPSNPDHIVLVTAGPQNREVKLWVSTSIDGWPLSCTQTLELKNSAEPPPEEAFFNQVVAMFEDVILLFTNAKRNAIYVIHIDYGPNPAATQMDYISEFTVAMPIASLTGTSDTICRPDLLCIPGCYSALYHGFMPVPSSIFGDYVETGKIEESFNSILEATVARQIQVQFQTSVNQALKEVLKSALEDSLIPTFEKYSKDMFEQVDVFFKGGIVEHTRAAQQDLNSILTLKEAITNAASLLVTQLSNEHDKVKTQMDPTIEMINRMVLEGKYDGAFFVALHRLDVDVLLGLCSQVDLELLLAVGPSSPISQSLLMGLLQLLGYDIERDTGRKLSLMMVVASAINPDDSLIAFHIRPIFQHVLGVLSTVKKTSLSAPEQSSFRKVKCVITSILRR